MKFTIIATVLLLALTKSDATILNGTCADFVPLTEFDVAAYLGRWYEIERFPLFYEVGNTCVTADYGYLSPTSITVTNTALTAQGELENATAIGTTTDMPGQLVVTFDDFKEDEEPRPNYIVLGTDYVSYSTVYSCIPLGDGRKDEFAWILSRTPAMDDATLTNAESIYDAIDVDISVFKPTVQGADCIYAPEPDVYE